MATQKTELVLTTVGGERVKATLESIGTAGKKAFDTVQSEATKTAGSLKVLDAAVGEVKGRVEGMAGTLGSVLGSAGTPMAALGVAATAAAASFGALYKSATDVAGTLTDQAAKSGFSTTKIQELAFAARQAGVEQEQLVSALAKFSKAVGEARAGSGSLTSALKDTDRALLDQIRNAGSVEQAFSLFIGKLGSLRNEQDKAALGAAGFSKGYAQLAGVLGQGNAALEEAAATARKFGIIIDADLIKKGDEAGDALGLLADSIKGQLYTAVLQAGPELKSFAETLAKIAGFGIRAAGGIAGVLTGNYTGRANSNTPLGAAQWTLGQTQRELESARRTAMSGDPAREADARQRIATLEREVKNLEEIIAREKAGPSRPAPIAAPASIDGYLKSRGLDSSPNANSPEELRKRAEALADYVRSQGLTLKLGEQFRSESTQAAYYNQRYRAARARGMSDAEARDYLRGQVAVPGNSRHQSGLAIDMSGSGLTLAGQVAEQFGLHQPVLKARGSDPYHFELIGSRGGDVKSKIEAEKKAREQGLEHAKSIYDELQKMEDETSKAGLDGIAKLMAERDVAYRAWEARAKELGSTEEERARGHAAIWQKYEREIAQTVEKEAEKRAADEERIREKELATAERLATEQRRIMEKQAEEFRRPYENFFQNVQEGFGDLFTSILDDGKVTSDEFVGIWKSAGSRLLGELASLAINRALIRPLTAVLLGGEGSAGGASSTGLIGSLFGAASTATAGSGGYGNLLSSLFGVGASALGGRSSNGGGGGGGFDATSLASSAFGLGLEAYGLYTGQTITTTGLLKGVAGYGLNALGFGGLASGLGLGGAAAGASGALAGTAAGLAAGAAPAGTAFVSLASGGVGLVNLSTGAVTSLGAGASLSGVAAGGSSLSSMLSASMPYLAAAVGAYLYADSALRYSHRSRRHVPRQGDYQFLEPYSVSKDDHLNGFEKFAMMMFPAESNLLLYGSLFGADIFGIDPSATDAITNYTDRFGDRLNNLRGSRRLFGTRHRKIENSMGDDASEFLALLAARHLGTKAYYTPGVGNLRDRGVGPVKHSIARLLGGGLEAIGDAGGDPDRVLDRIVKRIVGFDEILRQFGRVTGEGRNVENLARLLQPFSRGKGPIQPGTDLDELAARLLSRGGKIIREDVIADAVQQAYLDGVRGDGASEFDGFRRLRGGRRVRRTFRAALGDVRNNVLALEGVTLSDQFGVGQPVASAEGAIAAAYAGLEGLTRRGIRRELPETVSKVTEATNTWAGALDGLFSTLRSLGEQSMQSRLQLGELIDSLRVEGASGGLSTGSRYASELGLLNGQLGRASSGTGRLAILNRIVGTTQGQLAASIADIEEGLAARGIPGLAGLDPSIQGLRQQLTEQRQTPAAVIAGRRRLLDAAVAGFRGASGDDRVRYAQDVARLLPSWLEVAGGQPGSRGIAMGLLDEVGGVTSAADAEQRQAEKRIRELNLNAAQTFEALSPQIAAAFAQSEAEARGQLGRYFSPADIERGLADPTVAAQLVRQAQLDRLTDLLDALRDIRDNGVRQRPREGTGGGTSTPPPTLSYEEQRSFGAGLSGGFGDLRKHSRLTA